jgi:hypothetical protein
MKGKFYKSFLLVIVIVSVTVGLAAAREPHRSAPDKVPRFLNQIEKAGFSWQEGVFSYFDLIKHVCEEDGYFSAMGNNPWPNAYFVLQMPNPPDFMYDLPFDLVWQMRQDEAIVLIGQTPPPVRYFGIQTWVNLGPASPPGANVTDNRTLIGAAFGDSINNLTVRTTGSNPFDRPIVNIITGNQQTERLVRKALLAAGYPEAIINVERLSTVIAPLGYGPSGSILLMAQRIAVPADKTLFEDYVRRSINDDPDDDPYRVFRVSLENEAAPDPYPVPTLRVRGTGKTEMDLYPALKSLGKAIIASQQDMPYKELGVRFWQDMMSTGQVVLADEPWPSLQNGQFGYQGTRDAIYWTTFPPFKLRSELPSDEKEYVIVYGVNHHRTGKAAYTSFSAYVEPVFGTGREIGLGTVSDPDFEQGGSPGDSARQYLKPDDPFYEYADMLYAWKIARKCDDGEPYCLEVGEPKDIDGVLYNLSCSPQIDLDADSPSWASDVFVAFRNYMEPATAVSADSNELVWDQAIYFGPYFDEP